MRLEDTIVAISTPPGRGGLGIVRLSGGQAQAISSAILRFPRPPGWHPWQAFLAELPGPGGASVDQVVVTYYQKPRSYTAEDVVEISCHGSPVILRHTVSLALAQGARLAEPGEFTLRAFLNGRIDLPQAEAVRDLIEATTLYQARIAAQQAAGSVSRRLAPFKEQLLELIALLEAGIDFAEDDINVASRDEILRRLDPLRRGLDDLAASFAFGRLVHAGAAIAILGRPNVGKSSLFNRLLEQDRAIVTAIPGTTRDLVSETASIEGIPIRFVDTAGIHTGQDLVEQLGIERSFQAMADADLVLVVVDRSAPPSSEDERLIERARRQGRFLAVGNKSDLPAAPGWDGPLLEISALTGAGIPELRRAIFESLTPGGLAPESGFITSLRHEGLLKDIASALAKARQAALEGVPHEMLLLDLYAALQALDAITGATTADDIINRIFSTFCIGK